MHNYLRAIGFSKYKTDTEFRPVLDKILNEAKKVFSFSRTTTEKGVFFIEEFGPHFGLKLFAPSIRDNMREQFYFPFFDSNVLSSKSACRIEKKSDSESYLGTIDLPSGCSLIFHVSNPDLYTRKAEASAPSTTGKASPHISGVALTGFSTEGKIILPVKKSVREVEYVNALSEKKDKLYAAAVDGDADAIDLITFDDIALSTTIMDMLHNNIDVYSVVDTCLVPSGLESIKYLVIGEIVEVELVKNEFTNEELYRLVVLSNDTALQIVINCEDLLGEPEVGRRFKGYVGLEGKVICI